MRKTITVKYLKKINACQAAINSFQAQEERDTIRVLRKCLETDHFDWANWLIARLMNRKQQLRYTIYVAELVLPIWEEKYPDDKRPQEAIQATKKVLKRDSEENREAAYVAAEAAHTAAYVAADVVAYAAADVAYYAAADVAHAAYAAAYAAADVADAKTKIIEYGIKILKR